MNRRLVHVVLIVAAMLSSLCCCRAGGWASVLGVLAASPACPLCEHPAHDPSGPVPPGETCPACAGAVGTIPDLTTTVPARGDLLIAAWPDLSAALTFAVRPARPSWLHHEPPRSEGGRDLLRRRCALIV